MDRIVLPELLDSLPPGDPDAQRSRRDLRRVNRLMRNAPALREALQNHLPRTTERPWMVLEAGAGDGTLAARVWTRLPPPPGGSRLLLLDRLPVVEDQPRSDLATHGWIPETLETGFQEWLDQSAPDSLDLLYANLFLHHFDHVTLARLLAQIAGRAKAVALMEPRRSLVALLATRMLRCVGCNSITRHDALCSVRAGFCGTEITSMWPEKKQWILTESAAGFFGHRFTARRRSPS